MIAELYVFIWLLALTVPLYWACPATWRSVRLGIICITSAIFLLKLSPIIFVTVAAYFVGISLVLGLYRAGIRLLWLKRLSWGFFVPLLLVPYISTEFLVSGLLGKSALGLGGIQGFAMLGISYTAIRSFMLVRQALEGKPARVSEQLTTLLFFGSFSAGPICNAKPWQALAPTPDGAMFVVAISRFFWGLAAFLVLSPVLRNLPVENWFGLSDESILAGWISIWKNFLAIYLDFTGYTHIAIASGLFFGAKLPENFNWPLRSTSIQEFWQRWHRSLGAFIGTYLFKPMVRSFGKPTLAIFVAFVFVGLWHQANVLYLIWGIGHGAALALNMVWSKSQISRRLPESLAPFRSVFGWGLTISYVSLLSAFANSADLAHALALLEQLFGLRF